MSVQRVAGFVERDRSRRPLPRAGRAGRLQFMQRQFESLRAAELFCPRCRTARPVRERLLLVLPNGELHDYRCEVCGESCGSREVRGPPPGALPHRAPPKAVARRRPI